MLKIGALTISSRCILAPMAGVSDLPTRMVNRSLGCEFAFVEMINACALAYLNRKTKKMLLTVPEDRPLGIQLFGNDPKSLQRAIDVLLTTYEFNLIDFNAACPVSKVTKRGEGAGLLKEPRRLRELLKVLVKSSPVPVTVKIRSGWDETSCNAREVSLHAQEAGIQGLFIHGRTRSQGYSGSVDYQVISEVKEALEIPVIASGDTFSPQLVKRMFDETGCDGVAIARGSLGNPWIFRESEQFLRSGILLERPDFDEITRTMITHLDLCIDFHGEVIGTMVFRKYFFWYTKGMYGIKPLRDEACRAKTKDHIMDLIHKLRVARERKVVYTNTQSGEGIDL
jgi:tRNA-dihydrouridine synthase B